MRIKKFFIILILINILFVNNNVFAEINLDEDLKVYSKHIICIERTTGKVLYEKDAYSRCAMASTTKILTGIIVIENCKLNDIVTISKRAASTGGSTLGIKENEKITVENLLYGLLLRSGNDTAVALAEYVSGDINSFANLMNKKAKKVGLKNSNFVTPHGLDDPNHYTTAYDLAILTNYALKNDIFRKIVGTKQISINIGGISRILNNTNELLGNVDGVYGVKTGFTGNAGRCLVTACKRKDLDIIIVVLGADTKSMRGEDTKKIINYIYENFIMMDVKNEIEESFNFYKNNKKIKIVKSLNRAEIKIDKDNNLNYPIDKRKISKLKTNIFCLDKIEAPLNSNIVIGKLRLKCENKILYETDVYLGKKIKRINWKQYMVIFVKKYVTFYSI